MSSTTAGAHSAPLTKDHRKVIFASSLGTVFEWYDFYLYGSLAVIIGKQFFGGLNETSQFIFALLAFAAGFAVRPFGALVFGRLGDMIGRKYTFLVTIVLMGLSTFLVGILPSYATLGILAPIILIVLRLLQGLALGGEYGGAATYVAEHAPNGKRGLYTSFIQTTATIGLFLSLLVIWGCRNYLGKDAFEAWGWRIPFWVSVILLGVSVWIRMQLAESPLFQQMKAEGKTSKAPITESFFSKNGKIALLALLGATAGQAVVWYGGQFYSLFFLTKTLGMDPNQADIFIAIALALATGGFIFFGWLSDKIGRKVIVLGGCLIAVVTYFPVFKALTHNVNPALEAAVAASPVTVTADPARCAFQFDPVGKATFKQSCDVIKSALAKKGIPYQNAPGAAGSVATVSIGGTVLTSFEGEALDSAAFKSQSEAFGKQLTDALAAASYPAKADPAQMNKPMVIALLTFLVLLVTMVYGPIAAWLVELFPTRIRYTSMSLPYHIGNGWFGGFLPFTAFAIVAATGNIYSGLWYPVVVAAFTVVIGALFLPETKDRDITE
ncbi:MULTISPECIES: MFS transporter [Lysobacter]|uniref:Transporter, major facilitator superfamily n=2 Tax=Lysobacter TaxID=68 RepID=A0A0S2DAF7_LYSEN|nr:MULTISPECIES: MFS transporter [Lysobacter]ALN55513.1 transporter, major facilitator superfamily [Lysobacter enzymogenes]QCW24574.1 MHS family MFS transporter [Lysobacter enzymogenes]QQQ01187.1 MFS transporter [Lysobacter enzymogenes]UZW60459.1 MFS transporter [Lysobacter enzymogenes]WMT04343.1 MFS transporter [Lysobacter yananisis]